MNLLISADSHGTELIYGDSLVALDDWEMDAVGGGVIPLIPIAYVGIAASVGTLALGGGFLGGVHMGYYTNLY
jgi:hypothetical protein